MLAYRLLLRLYPTSFRHEYGEEMVRLFRERRRSASFGGRLALWLEAFGDALGTAPRVHLDLLQQDLRYTRRTLGRTPGFAVAAVLVMALGIGASTAVFSITDRVLLRPLPFSQPDRLVRVWENVPGYPQLEPSPANYRDWTQMTRSFDVLAGYIRAQMNMIAGEPERVNAGAVTPDLLPMLGVQPLLGRFFSDEEGRPGGPDVVVLSERVWRRSFNADPSVLGRPVRLDESTATVIGVMPPDFYFPDRQTDIWVPLRLGPAWFVDRDNNSMAVFGRLKPGASLETAREDMNTVMAALERAYPRENARARATVRLLSDQVTGQSRLILRVLTGASICVLLIACTNLASLLLTRFTARRRELTVRAALGAGRERLTRQLLTESLVLALAGGAMGIAIAAGATPLLVRLVPTSLPVSDATALDPRVLGFAALVTMMTGIVFGVLPAWRACQGTDGAALREGPRGSVGTGSERLRAGLVIAQITVSIVLLVSAGLLMRALVRVQSTDPGFDAARVLTLRTTLPVPRYNATMSRAQFYERVIDRVRTLPGVTGAAYTSFTPMVMRGGIWPVEMPGISRDNATDDPHTASLRYITSGFFETLGIPLRRGRDLSPSDTLESPFVAVVSESFARRYWPGEEAIGRRFTFAFDERLIVGVAGDVRVRGLESVSEPQVYLPYKQVRDGALPFYSPKDLLIRTSGDPMSIATAVRGIVREADPELPVSDLQTMEEVVAQMTAPRRTQIAVLGLFAGMSMLLAGIGLHGLLSFGVSQRRQEIGVRMALGAQRSDVLRLVLGEGSVLAGAGIAAGLALAYAAARWFDTLLAGVQPADLITYGAAVALTAFVTLSGSLVPAIRAIRVDPVTALRAE